MDIPNPKCGTCKSYWEPDDNDIKSSGLIFRNCKKSRENSIRNNIKRKCEHSKRTSKCKECGGSQICPHDVIRSSCKECEGSQICPHNKRRSRCKECGGNSICEHNKRKSECKECNLPLYLVNLQKKNINRCLKTCKLSKTKPSIEYFGCSSEYFEEFFQKKMDNFNYIMKLK